MPEFTVYRTMRRKIEAEDPLDAGKKVSEKSAGWIFDHDEVVPE